VEQLAPQQLQVKQPQLLLELEQPQQQAILENFLLYTYSLKLMPAFLGEQRGEERLEQQLALKLTGTQLVLVQERRREHGRHSALRVLALYAKF